MIAAPVPGDLDRDEARELAREELSNPAYERGRPILSRVLEWIADQVGRIIDAATGSLSSQLGLAIVVAVAVGFAAFVVLRAGPLSRRVAERTGAVLPDRPRSAAEYRAAADAAADRGDWTTAVVERFRAVVAGLEERGVLDPRPGRTADEAAAEATAALSMDGYGMRAGARLFDAVRYGGVAAAPDDDRRLRALDDAVAAARPRTDRPADGGPVLAVPR